MYARPKPRSTKASVLASDFLSSRTRVLISRPGHFIQFPGKTRQLTYRVQMCANKNVQCILYFPWEEKNSVCLLVTDYGNKAGGEWSAKLIKTEPSRGMSRRTLCPQMGTPHFSST